MLIFTLSVFYFVYLREQNLHFAPFYLSSLVVNSKFHKPNLTLFAMKLILVCGYFDLFFACFSMIKEGSSNAIGVYFYACRFAFSTISSCI